MQHKTIFVTLMVLLVLIPTQAIAAKPKPKQESGELRDLEIATNEIVRFNRILAIALKDIDRKNPKKSTNAEFIDSCQKRTFRDYEFLVNNRSFMRQGQYTRQQELTVLEQNIAAHVPHSGTSIFWRKSPSNKGFSEVLVTPGDLAGNEKHFGWKQVSTEFLPHIASRIAAYASVVPYDLRSFFLVYASNNLDLAAMATTDPRIKPFFACPAFVIGATSTVLYPPSGVIAIIGGSAGFISGGKSCIDSLVAFYRSSRNPKLEKPNIIFSLAPKACHANKAYAKNWVDGWVKLYPPKFDFEIPRIDPENGNALPGTRIQINPEPDYSLEIYVPTLAKRINPASFKAGQRKPWYIP